MLLLLPLPLYAAASLQLSRAAPRTLSLPASLQPLAACQWLMDSIRQSAEYHQQQHAQQQQQQQQQQSQQQPSGFLSWKYRDPAVLTQAGLEASVRQVGLCSIIQRGKGGPHMLSMLKRQPPVSIERKVSPVHAVPCWSLVMSYIELCCAVLCCLLPCCVVGPAAARPAGGLPLCHSGWAGACGTAPQTQWGVHSMAGGCAGCARQSAQTGLCCLLSLQTGNRQQDEAAVTAAL